jgi:hypothetical protein
MLLEHVDASKRSSSMVHTENLTGREISGAEEERGSRWHKSRFVCPLGSTTTAPIDVRLRWTGTQGGDAGVIGGCLALNGGDCAVTALARRLQLPGPGEGFST